MADSSPAKVYSDQRDLPIYLGDSGDGFTLPFKEKWRAPDAVAAVAGFIVTGTLVTTHLDGGHALIILIVGVAVTATTVWLLAKLPHSRPSAPTRLRWWCADFRPRVTCSHPRVPGGHG